MMNIPKNKWAGSLLALIAVALTAAVIYALAASSPEQATTTTQGDHAVVEEGTIRITLVKPVKLDRVSEIVFLDVSIVSGSSAPQQAVFAASLGTSLLTLSYRHQPKSFIIDPSNAIIPYLKNEWMLANFPQEVETAQPFEGDEQRFWAETQELNREDFRGNP